MKKDGKWVESLAQSIVLMIQFDFANVKWRVPQQIRLKIRKMDVVSGGEICERRYLKMLN